MTVHSEESNITRGWGRLAFDLAHFLLACTVFGVACEMFRYLPHDHAYAWLSDSFGRMWILITAAWALHVLRRVIG
jgi:hypothetical protein